MATTKFIFIRYKSNPRSGSPGQPEVIQVSDGTWIEVGKAQWLGKKDLPKLRGREFPGAFMGWHTWYTWGGDDRPAWAREAYQIYREKRERYGLEV